MFRHSKPLSYDSMSSIHSDSQLCTVTPVYSYFVQLLLYYIYIFYILYMMITNSASSIWICNSFFLSFLFHITFYFFLLVSRKDHWAFWALLMTGNWPTGQPAVASMFAKYVNFIFLTELKTSVQLSAWFVCISWSANRMCFLCL